MPTPTVETIQLTSNLQRVQQQKTEDGRFGLRTGKYTINKKKGRNSFTRQRKLCFQTFLKVPTCLYAKNYILFSEENESFNYPP